MNALPTLGELPAAVRRLLVRVDFNVPLKGGQVADDFRIRAAAPTVQTLLERQVGVTLISHLGRPGGRPNLSLSLEPLADVVARQVGCPVSFVPGVPGDSAYQQAVRSDPTVVLLAENLRFDPGEEANDPAFAARLASGHDGFVQDAFGTLHRSHASTVAVTKTLPSWAGPLVAAEVAALDALLSDPRRPFGLVVGGAKMKDKLPLLRRLLPEVDTVLIGGALASTFLAASGLAVGASLYEPGELDSARLLLDAWPDVIHLPDSVVVERAGGVEEVSAAEVLSDARIMDVGRRTLNAWRPMVAGLGRLFWNGPIGFYERPPFDQGTAQLARFVGEMTGMSVVGGGDSLAAVRRLGLEASISHLSTGGGAALAYLEGDVLPGLMALEER